MNPALELTSVPAWAVRPSTPPCDPAATACTAVAVGAEAVDVATTWLAGAVAPGRLHALASTDEALAVVDAELAEARVGWRLLVAGPLTAVLPLRARALAGGLVDAELSVATTTTDDLLVTCAHCAAVTSAPTHVGGVVPCVGCDRRLLVHHHVSRRQGTFLGYQVDAEQWGTEQWGTGQWETERWEEGA
ncbi:MAG: dimethylamine monooxygenase subunit DmmA family protein [Propionibacteriales bacterium]|nr:dimethylamine monooxygenase subunit DmmA family protein [Propionibacteriales bacterium]